MNLAEVLGLARGFGPRFGLVSLLPTAMLAVIVLFLVWGGAPQDAPDVDALLDRAQDLDGWSLALLFLALSVFTLVVEPLQLLLVRVLEGYFPGPFGRPGTSRQRRRWAALDARTRHQGSAPTPEQVLAMGAAASELRRRFPADPGHLLPTALGNALRAAESGAGEPYGLDAVVVWPRLYPLLSEGTRAVVDDQRDGLDRAVRFCAAFALAALVSVVLLATHGWWLLVPVVSLALAWISYRGAVQAAMAYGEGIRVAIDLHRFDMLAALHLALPPTLEEERAGNARLSSFLLQGHPADFVYDHGSAPASDAGPGAGGI